MKSFFLFSILTLALTLNLLIGSANAQWWVRGGNLLWPYGNVEIAKDLTVSGVTTLDSNVSVGGDLEVSGSVTENGIKELTVFIVWNLNSDPTVTVLKNTTGSTFTWDNVDDLGEQVTITANSGTPFTSGKTSFVENHFAIGGSIYFLTGFASSTSVYQITGYRNDGNQAAIPDLEFYLNIKIYP
ncbi:MAG: hypothetical protein DAHOPDDO_02483 [Ignavibacteriaceae bacterium]|nr:hypothetical protein [Ignavibacteriaceae bacterium]